MLYEKYNKKMQMQNSFLEAEDILRFDKGELTKVLYAESLMQPEKRAQNEAQSGKNSCDSFFDTDQKKLVMKQKYILQNSD